MQLMRHGNCGRRPIPVLTQNNVGFTTARVITIKCIGAMQKHNHVRILLQRTGFAQVRDLRLLICTLFWATVKLANCHYRNV